MQERMTIQPYVRSKEDQLESLAALKNQEDTRIASKGDNAESKQQSLQ